MFARRMPRVAAWTGFLDCRKGVRDEYLHTSTAWEEGDHDTQGRVNA
jgi:hypothetical protein